MDKQYYTYIYYDRGIPCYVGKGTGNRVMQHLGRDDFPKLENLTWTIRPAASEEAALCDECNLIQLFGLRSNGGILLNRVETDMPLRPSDKPSAFKPLPEILPVKETLTPFLILTGRAKVSKEEYERAVTEFIAASDLGEFESPRKIARSIQCDYKYVYFTALRYVVRIVIDYDAEIPLLCNTRDVFMNLRYAHWATGSRRQYIQSLTQGEVLWLLRDRTLGGSEVHPLNYDAIFEDETNELLV